MSVLAIRIKFLVGTSILVSVFLEPFEGNYLH
jgi:hypothetical protein